MKDLSAVLAGLTPIVAIRLIMGPDQTGGFFIFCGLVTVLTCLLIYNLLNYWPHGGLLVLLSLGVPPLFYVHVVIRHGLFYPLFLGATLVAILLALVGALIAEDWSWQGVGVNFAFFATTAIIVAAVSGHLGHVITEGALLAVGAFGITRLCQVNLLSWLAKLPGWIYKGLTGLWR